MPNMRRESRADGDSRDVVVFVVFVTRCAYFWHIDRGPAYWPKCAREVRARSVTDGW